MKRILIILVFVVSACSTHYPNIKLSSNGSNTLQIVGEVEPENEILQAINRGITKIQITSGGGEVRANIRIANVIREKVIALEVIDYCMSSCFSYLFLAAKERYIQPDSLLGFHGTGETSIPSIVKNIGLFASTIEYEHQFVSDMNFNQDIYENLSKRADQVINASGLDADLFMVGRKFFNENHIRLANAWFPKNQRELDETVSYLSNKYGTEKEQYKTLIMIGDFDY